jgi:hypothetical protein
MSTRFFIPLVPSKSENRKKGSATHFAKNQGIQPIRFDIAAYLANEIRKGNPEPQVFVCAWYDPKTDQINVGFEIPRDTSREPIATQRDTVTGTVGLEALFGE